MGVMFPSVQRPCGVAACVEGRRAYDAAGFTADFGRAAATNEKSPTS